jgi:radical SAM-linked protein
MQRIRIYYAKTQALRYTGNLDVHKIWERTLRRARLPLAYSQGFHPQPKLNQACPLPLGMLSRAEIIDIWLDPDLPLEQVEVQLTKSIPPGIEIDHLEAVDLHEPALQTQVAASRFQVTLLTLPGESQIGFPELSDKVASLLSAESLPRERRDKPYDLRPFIQQLEVIPPDEKGQPVLSMLLSATAGASGRPEEVLSAMGFDPSSTRIERVGLVFLS